MKYNYKPHNPFNFSVTNLYKFIDGKKYQYNGTIPKVMEYDVKRIFDKHGIMIKTEKAEQNSILLWSRKKWEKLNLQENLQKKES